MSDGRQPWESEEEPPRRDIMASELVGDPGTDGHNPVAEEIGGWMSRAIEAVRAKLRHWKGESTAEQAARGSLLAGRATATAVGALEGTLRGKSLDGELKEAQILEAFASARQKNAEALKAEAEADKLTAEAVKLRQDAAFERAERAIELLEKLGIPVDLAILPGGGIALTVGERLVGELPGLGAATEPAGLVTSGQAEPALGSNTVAEAVSPAEEGTTGELPPSAQ